MRGIKLNIIANWILLTATFILLWKLVTTNHWTAGKKMLVALTATTLWKVAFELLYLFGLFDFSIVTAITIANTPLAITMVAVAIIVNWFNH
jgi:hypothetical protein